MLRYLVYSMVPMNFAQDPKLAEWVHNQRVLYCRKMRNEKNKCKNSTNKQPQQPTAKATPRDYISPKRIALLNEIGFVWNALDVKWNAKFADLQSYVELNGFGNMPPKGYSPTLFSWMDRQRQRYRKHKLLDDRIRKLDEVGFIWNY